MSESIPRDHPGGFHHYWEYPNWKMTRRRKEVETVVMTVCEWCDLVLRQDQDQDLNL